MKVAAIHARVFLSAWLLFGVHFATNVVREHYPAFALVEDGNFRCDDYLGLHPDIFEHRDGHAYINNQVTASVLAAVPLLAFDPVLDRLEDHRKRQLRTAPAAAPPTYDTKYPLRQKFFAEVRRRGLDLRFGGATAVTSGFLMAPLAALMVVLMAGLLRQRGVPEPRAVGLAFLFGFGTPVLFRTATLNHNMLLAHAVFAAFVVLQPGVRECVSRSRRWWGGFLLGLALALDYSGVVPLLVLYGYCVWRRLGSVGLARSVHESLWVVAGAVPPVAFLCWSQWWMFGDPFLPAQFWMAPANFTGEGIRGFSWPSGGLAWMNLVDLRFGLFAFAPLLLVALWPVRAAPGRALVLPRAERRMTLVLFVLFLLFCSSNQYARMQWNTGIRYFMALVPFLFLAAADHLAGLSRVWLWVLAVPALLHSWVLAAAREQSVVDCWWEVLYGRGFQLPWASVLQRTSTAGTLPGGRWFSLLVLAGSGLAVLAIWKVGRRHGNGPPTPALPRGAQA